MKPRPADREHLSPRRRERRYRETHEVAGAAVGLIRAVGRRVATEDTEDLRHLIALDQALESAWRDAVAGLRTSGYTDRAIGAELGGLTKQAIQERWPRPQGADRGRPVATGTPTKQSGGAG